MAEAMVHEGGQQTVTFEEFREEWLREFAEGELTSFEKGQRFAVKLITQWLGVSDDDEDLVLCDGSGDGGIDIAYLRRSDTKDLIRGALVSQHLGNVAFQGADTVVNEGQKVIDTLTGENIKAV